MLALCFLPYEVVKLLELMPAHTADTMVYGGRFTETGKPIYVPLNSVAMAILKHRHASTP